MQLPTLTFSGLLEQMGASLQGSAAGLVDLTVGSVLRALLESCASVLLWLQWLIIQVLASTRAATSAGPDLDSWMADFSFARLPSNAAVGQLTFARYTPGLQATIPVGASVMTADGSLSFAVIADATNSAWNGAGYTLSPTNTSVIVPAQCLVAGPAGNVQPGTIGLISTSIIGVDTVSNASAFSGGASAETDVAFRARFQLYINSRSLATTGAVANAIAGVQTGLRWQVLENVSPSLATQPGNFVAIVDDGSGAPPATLLSAVQAAVDTVRPIGSTFAVLPPVVVTTAVTVVIETSNVQTHASVAAAIEAQIQAWLAALPVNGTLAVSKIDALAHDTDSSVISVTSTLINGRAQDLSAPINGVLIAASVTVS